MLGLRPALKIPLIAAAYIPPIGELAARISNVCLSCPAVAQRVSPWPAALSVLVVVAWAGLGVQQLDLVKTRKRFTDSFKMPGN